MREIKNKICLITGGTSGIGMETALELCRLGAKVAITYRNEQKAIETQNFFEKKCGVKPEIFFCDLSSFVSIRSFVEKFKSEHAKLEVLINNAGIWETKRVLSVDGIELNFATNHLAPFLLTNLLLDLMVASSPARIINVASGSHKTAEINFDDPEMKEKFNGYKAYGQSKLANILFTKSLSHKLAEKGVSVFCLHPGVVSTKIFNKMGKLAVGILRPLMISPEKGARTSVYLATAPQIESLSGSYFSRKKVVNSSPTSNSIEIADKLWEMSSKYVSI